ncbi:hypothetical protein ZTR_04329 [Talaromyces verruculosus]|nr:hypothetical protein ZTR_04329 [Talaromyces verruculosus]
MLFHADYNRPGFRRDDLALAGNKAKRAVKNVQRDIHTISENGQPLFTKDPIRDVRDQLNRSAEKGRKMIIRGLDDMPVEFTLVTSDMSLRIIRDDEGLGGRMSMARTSMRNMLCTTLSIATIQSK